MSRQNGIKTVQYSTLVKASVAFLLLGTSARAFSLTDSDYEHFTTQNVSRDSSVLRGLRASNILSGVISRALSVACDRF
jgi:hypothetical protein